MNTIFVVTFWLTLIKFIFAPPGDPCYPMKNCMKCLSNNFKKQNIYCEYYFFCNELKESEFNVYKNSYEYDKLYEHCKTDDEYEELKERYNFMERESTTQKISLKKGGNLYASQYLYTEWDSSYFMKGDNNEVLFNFQMDTFSSEIDLLYFKVKRQDNTYYYDVKNYIDEHQNPFLITNVSYYKVFYIALEDRNVLPFSAEITHKDIDKGKNNAPVIIGSSASAVLGVAIIGLIIYCCCCKEPSNPQQNQAPQSRCSCCHCHWCESTYVEERRCKIF